MNGPTRASGRTWSSRLLATLVLLSACNRYETVSPECPEEPRQGQSAIAWKRGGADGSISGRLLDITDRAPVVAASVALEPGKRAAHTGSDGRFAFDSLLPGDYTLTVRRIGYDAKTTSIDLRVSTGVEVLAIMSANAMMLDGCSYVYIERRKPWWKP